ncbi:MAG TPA: DUF3372 domain-containing protein, partial [Thermoflexia bacterium]|nr:DUF3372 domain-containing protein [Thermoflexia bacterium]
PDPNTTLSAGMEHLLALQAAGLTHVHLLPSFDIASVPEASVARTPTLNPTGYARDAEEPQATIALSRTTDGFNWGYDPYHYGAPEGSYSTNPDGVTRILEFRRMIAALNQNGLRVVMDVVYNHTSASGQAAKSVLDKIVPGYYYRYDTNGVLQQTSCCPDTACEYEMMEKLMVDTLVRFAEDYRVDGFRFDLMNLHTQRNMLNVQSAINAIDPDIYLYGEGWDFGSAKDKGLTDCAAGWCYAQKYNMTGKGIGLFNDIIRDATHGGYSQNTTGIREQGFSNGLSYDWNGYAYSNRDQSALHTVMDTLRSALRASGVDYNGQGAPFTDDPQESVAYVEKHDNETLFDQNAFKLPHGNGSGNDGWIGSGSIPTTTITDRVRAQNMGQSLIALSQGVPFFQMGTDILRSKSLDRNSYDSGDWFNKVYWDYSENNFGKGLPPAWDNDIRWDIMRPLLTDTTTLDPATTNIEFAAAHFRELLRLRYSSPLFRLTTEADVNARASYYNGDNLLDGFLAFRLSDEVAPDLDSSYENIFVFFNANKAQQSITISGAEGFTLHPLHTDGVDDDPVVQSAVFDDTTDTFTIPARTTVVFVSDQALTSPSAPSTLDWVGLLWPRGGTANRLDEGNASSDLNLYVQVYEEGVTEAAGEGADIDCYLHWGEYGESWATDLMTYNVDQGNNDEYMITITQSTLNALPPGTYGFTAYCQKTAEAGQKWKEDSYDINGDSSDDDQGDGLLTVIPTGDTSPAPAGGVFVHLFEWPWTDVEKECTFLAEKGYAAVQVSPPNEHLVPTADMNGVTTNDYPWWVRYQPVTHLTTTLTSRSGTWTEFTSMVDTCNSLGVGIYVDAVINHTADIEVGSPPTGTHGTEYHSTPAASRAYGAQYQAGDFHPECTISSYEDRQQVQLCELSELPDLDTGKVAVQTEINNYLQALLDVGVKGFRIDGAKHIRAQDIAALLDGLTLPGGGTPFIFQEVIDQSSDEPVRDWEYAPHGDVTEFAYAFALGDKFDDACGGTLSQLESRFDDADMLPSRFAVVFTDNHDNQRGHGVGSGCVVDHRDGQEHLLANIFALAYPYGYPKVMSSYYWQSSSTDNSGDSMGPPSTADGGSTWGVGRGAATRSVYGASQVAGDAPANCAAAYEDGKWVCEHRQTAIANLVQFRQVTDGEAVSNWQNIGGAPSDHIAFGRGAKGFVALNRTGSNATTTYTTGMPEGDYCDSVSGQRTADGSACTGTVISVDASHQIVNYTLASMSAFVIHTEARLGAPQLDASQDFDLARDAHGPVTATLQTHAGSAVPNQTITFTLESGAGSLGAPVVTATTDISGVASVTYTAPSTLTVALISAAYRASEGTRHESLSAVYVAYRAAVAELLARRLSTGEVSLSLGDTLTITKQGSGAPLITLAKFTGNPQSNQAGDSVKSAFVDLYLPDATAVTTLTVEIACTATCASGDTVWWGNPVTGDWTAVANAAADFSGDKATFTLTVSSTPSLTQLDGAPFVVSRNEPLAISLHAFQATRGVSRLWLLTLLGCTILGICASAFGREQRKR